MAVLPHSITHRSLTPRREDGENLLVPVCLSASHVAFASVRMEPTLLLVGHMAGAPAVQDIDTARLQRSRLD